MIAVTVTIGFKDMLHTPDQLQIKQPNKIFSTFIIFFFSKLYNFINKSGRYTIRTCGTVSRTTVFRTAAIDHSANLPV